MISSRKRIRSSSRTTQKLKWIKLSRKLTPSIKKRNKRSWMILSLNRRNKNIIKWLYKRKSISCRSSRRRLNSIRNSMTCIKIKVFRRYLSFIKRQLRLSLITILNIRIRGWMKRLGLSFRNSFKSIPVYLIKNKLFLYDIYFKVRKVFQKILADKNHSLED